MSVPTNGNDVLVGDAGDNVIDGLSGDDIVYGRDGKDRLTGSAGIDILYGESGDDVLNGAAGADRTEGGPGNDLHYIGDAGDIVVELAGEGIDTVATTVSYILTANVEHLQANDVNGSAPLHLTGNSLANTIYATQGNNILNGAAGGDFMVGYAGNDLFYVDDLGDVAYELVGGGIDTVVTSISFIIGANIESLQANDIGGNAPLSLTGNSLDNQIFGTQGNNILNGAGGADFMVGYAGNDLYYIDHAGDVAYELVGGGVDTAITAISFAIGANIESLQANDIGGSDPLTLTGNELANQIYATQGNNVLNGGGGADFMVGYAGHDLYYVDHLGDFVYEEANGGSDLVVTTISFALGENVENLQSNDIGGTAALTLTGNSLANNIYGTFGDNVLNGAGGADFMVGYGGNDLYYVDHAGDVAYEDVNGGIDVVATTVSYTLGANVESLQANDIGSNAALTLVGNDLANNIYATQGSNLLNGAGGADFMVGFGGDDTYIVDHAGDVAYEETAAGTDTVITSVSLTLGANLENLLAHTSFNASIALVGNAGANVIAGNAGDNHIDGKGGIDGLTGGAGADIFAFTTALAAANIDTIADFAPGVDRILLGGQSGEPFAALATGALSAAAFATGAAASDADDRILYNAATGALLYDADGVGGAAAVQFASVGAGLALTAASFTVSGPVNQLAAIVSGATASVAENSLASTIVYQIQASDPDGDTLSYRLDGADAAKLTIDAAGAVRLVSPADFETQNSYSFTVHAADSSGAGASRAVTLSVTDVAEALPRYLVTDQEANDSRGAAQALDRSMMTPTSDANVPSSTLPSATITGSISTDTDKDFFSITLNAGELLILDVDGTDVLDSELRVYGPNGVEIALNDDPGSFDPGSSAHAGLSHNMDSVIRVRAPTTGIYTFSIASFKEEDGRTSTGSYTLHVVIGPPATQAQIDEENIQSMLSGDSWDTLALTYGFPTSGSQYGPNEGTDEIAAGMQALNSGQQLAVQTILTQFSNVTNLTFTENSGSPGSAQLRFARSGDPDTAHAYEPGPGNGGDSWYNTNKYSSPTVGNYQWLTFIHETGHALGLKHGHASPALSPDRDSMEFSVMTYRGYIGAPVGDEYGYTNETWGYAQTLMMYDIAALQRMYGADFTYNAGDTVYSWDPATGAFRIDGVTQWTPGGNRIFMTVWDGGGIDTYDFSNYTSFTPRTIDLRPGEWTKLGDTQLANLGNGFARGNIANSLLYNGDPRSLIENAIGSQISDWIIANDASNRLTGAAGEDRFVFYTVSASSVAAPDTITDFVSGGDKITLSDIDANSGTPADEAFSYIGTSAFSGVAGQLRHESVGGTTHIYGDVNGDSLADMHIIVNAPAITI